jgi:hypothetical protein
MLSANSATCAANPAICVAQTSPQLLSAVTDNPACQGDPLYTPGSPYATGVTATTGAVATTNIPGTTATTTNGALPVVVLPTNTGSGSANPINSGTIGLPSGTGVAVTSQSANPNGGVREGRTIARAANGASGSSSGLGAIKPSSISTGPSELIAAGGVIVASGASGISRGPASDVESQYGPSLFATSSQVIRLHCQYGKLNNCP